jgi:hypothetical protein
MKEITKFSETQGQTKHISSISLAGSLGSALGINISAISMMSFSSTALAKYS